MIVKRAFLVLAAAGVMMGLSGQQALGQSSGPGPVAPVSWPMEGADAQNTRCNPSEGEINPRNVSGLQLAWSRSFVCSVYANPVVVDGVVYTGDYCYNIYALDAITGQTRWSRDVGGCSYSPAVADGRVFVGSRHTPWFYALDELDGAVIWRFPTGDLVRCSPTVVGGTVYVGSTDGKVYALKASAGTRIWAVDTSGDHVGTPAFSHGVVYVTAIRPVGGVSNPWLFAIRARTGAVLWTIDLGLNAAFPRNPSVVDGVVYVGGDRMRALDARTGQLLWSSRPGTNWRSQAIGPNSQSRTIYATSDDGQLRAFEAATGQVLWNARVGQRSGHPCLANGVVFVTEGPGPSDVYAFHAESGQLLWSQALGGLPYGAGSPVTVVDGMVYVPVTFDYRIDAYRLP